MWIYRVQFFTRDGDNDGYSYHSNQRNAQIAATEAPRVGHSPKIELLEVTPTQTGIVDFLNQYASGEAQ